MPETYHYYFDWDPKKATNNRRKHGVSFDEASAVFRDPLAITVYDDMHSVEEERWITIGTTLDKNLLVVVHTFQEVDEHSASVRIISARLATRHEQRDYEAN